MTEPFVPTSVARRLIARMRATHERRRISIFSGPPGIGKTTAIDAFRSQFPDAVAVVKIARRNARETLVLQHVLEAVRALSDSPLEHCPSSIRELRNGLFGTLCDWGGTDARAARRGRFGADQFGSLTIIFDEAQNLSREAIESLRFWNDPDRCYSPFPLGLIFVGNNEFSLRVDSSGHSVISAAVADRALYSHAFDYEELTDGDLELFITAYGVTDPGAGTAIVRSFRDRRAHRSLRRVLDMIEELTDAAAGEIITAQTVRGVIEALQ
jgi:hypothetical protein